MSIVTLTVDIPVVTTTPIVTMMSTLVVLFSGPLGLVVSTAPPIALLPIVTVVATVPCSGFATALTITTLFQGVTTMTNMTAAMIVALGENNLAVPCLMFATVVEAERFLTDRFGPMNDRGWWGGISSDTMRHCADIFFLDYYDGCGGIDAFKVCEVKSGEPIVAFDLD